MENGGARILAAFEPCILTDGSVVLNLPDEQGIQLVAANIQAGQTTQSAVVPMQRIAPITEGQTLYTVDLNEQITGADPATEAQVTLNGNINALFLLNLGGQEVEFSGDNSVALNAILRR
jgi:alpha-N-acetylglucosamine transferase